MKQWDKLFTHLEVPLHAANMVLERVDYKLAMAHRDLKEALMGDNHLPGELLGLNISHWPSIGVHANQNTPEDHTDNKSLHLGFDNILPFGDFRDGWLLFPDLGIRIKEILS